MLLLYGKLFKILCTLYSRMLLIPTQKKINIETKDWSLNDNRLNNFLQCKKTNPHMLISQKIHWYGNLHFYSSVEFIDPTDKLTFLNNMATWTVEWVMSSHTLPSHYLNWYKTQSSVFVQVCMCICVCVCVCVCVCTCDTHTHTHTHTHTYIYIIPYTFQTAQC